MATEVLRKAPRISVNKLGEYMTATPLRRRRIVRDQRQPKSFILPRYTEAQDVIVKYLVGGNKDLCILTAEIERLQTAPSATEWEEHRKALCAKAIARFLNLAESVDLSGLSASRGGNDQPRLQLGGLEISVRPEVILRGQDRRGEQIAGAIKLYLSKTIPLSEEGGGYVAAAVHEYVGAHVEPGSASPRQCQVIDVFDARIYTAPQATVRRRNDLVAACEEIVRAWENA
jgi:hypothetical protein